MLRDSGEFVAAFLDRQASHARFAWLGIADVGLVQTDDACEAGILEAVLADLGNLVPAVAVGFFQVWQPLV